PALSLLRKNRKLIFLFPVLILDTFKKRIMKHIYIILAVFLTACSDDLEVEIEHAENLQVAEMNSGENKEEVPGPDRSMYIDEEIAGEIQLEFGPLNEVINARI